MRIAILGGTGPEGLGIAARLAKAGESVVVGSRSRERAAKAVERLLDLVPGGRIEGGTNPEAAAAGDVVFLTVPWQGLDPVLDACANVLDGKIVVDTVVPVRVVDGYFDLEQVPGGSVSRHVQERIPGARVVAALKNQSAVHLIDLAHRVEGDVLLCGNDTEARSKVAELIRRIPDLRPVDTGDLRHGRSFERMTALLLNLNRRYGVRASFRITGLGEGNAPILPKSRKQT